VSENIDPPQLKPRGFRSERCPVCSLPPASCICAHIAKANNSKVHVVLFRHPKEKKRASGTGFLALACMSNVTLLEPGEEARLFSGEFPGPIAMLFPPDGEDQLFAPAAHPDLRPGTIVVPDGSWNEARRMVRRHSNVRAIPRVSPQWEHSRWIANPLRQDKWNRPCTAEALGMWLEEQGETEVAAQLRKSLHAFVEAHRANRGDLRKNAN
jgi:DTW domain-containing protein YfiP